MVVNQRQIGDRSETDRRSTRDRSMIDLRSTSDQQKKRGLPPSLQTSLSITAEYNLGWMIFKVSIRLSINEKIVS